MYFFFEMQKEAYEEFKESIAVAEIFVEMKANQTQKEAKQAYKEAKQTQKEAKQAQKEANKKAPWQKKSRQRPQIKLMLGFARVFNLFF